MKREKLLASSTLIAALAIGLFPHNAKADATLAQAFQASKPILEANLRYETVDQIGIANEADALTARVRLGFQTGKYKNWALLAEVEAVGALVSDFNTHLGAKPTYPIVNDPDGVELNRFALIYTPSAKTTFTLGRQRIVLDDSRFIGNVGWRQDEQTFDAARFDTKFGKLNLTAAYISHVNRIFASDKDLSSNSFIVNASYPFSDAFKATGFAYLLDFSDEKTPADLAFARASSTNTIGIRVSGTIPVDKVRLGYIAQFANQTDAGDNPNSVDLNEYMIEGSLVYKRLTLKANYEVLEGDGTVGFVTPLGTTHAFQGNSDVFSVLGGNKTLANGIEDLSFTIGLSIPTPASMTYFKNPSLSVTYHDFQTERLNQDIGEEIDAIFGFNITPKLNFGIKYADFDRANTAMPASRTKTWVYLGYKF